MYSGSIIRDMYRNSNCIRDMYCGIIFKHETYHVAVLIGVLLNLIIQYCGVCSVVSVLSLCSIESVSFGYVG